MIVNDKVYKAISVRYKEEDFEKLIWMKEVFCREANEDWTTNRFMKEMIEIGFDTFCTENCKEN